MMNKSPPVFYRTSSPSGPLPCFLSLQFTIVQSRATCIADHVLPLGDLLFVILSVRSSVRPPQALSGLKSALSGLKFTLSGLKSASQALNLPSQALNLPSQA